MKKILFWLFALVASVHADDTWGSIRATIESWLNGDLGFLIVLVILIVGLTAAAIRQDLKIAIGTIIAAVFLGGIVGLASIFSSSGQTAFDNNSTVMLEKPLEKPLAHFSATMA